MDFRIKVFMDSNSDAEYTNIMFYVNDVHLLTLIGSFVTALLKVKGQTTSGTLNIR